MERRCWRLGTEPERGEQELRRGAVATRTKGTMYLALTWTTTAVPLPPLLRHSHFRRYRRVTVSFLDRATSSPGTRTLCTASHIACTVRMISATNSS